MRGTHFFDSTPSACLPCGTAIGATFDTELVKRLGGLLSDEAHAKGAHVLLGPTVNIQRSPLGGRGFESYSEDPVLSGILAGHYVNGVQESGVSATLKHYVCNDMESERMAVNAIVTERAMREIYLLPFMIAIEMGKPRAIMTSYSQLNGHHAAENKHILQDVLRDDWKWDGLLMSDWYGTYSTSEAINAGLDLEMPGPTRWRGETLAHAVTANKVKKSVLDSAVRNILKLVKHGLENTKIPPNAPETEANTPEHIALLREAAAKSLVLLKNERSILPFDKTKKVAVIGPNATIATYCGGGSAGLRAYKTVTPLEGIKGLASDVVFSQGAYGHQSLPLLGKNLRTPDGKQKGFVLRIYNDPPAANGAADDRKALEERVLDDANIWFVDYENADLNPLWWAETEGILTPERSGEWDFGLSVHGTGELYIDGKLVVSNVENQRLGSSFLGCGTVEETGRMHLDAGKDYRVLVRFGCSATSKIKPSGTVDFGQGGVRFAGCPRLEPKTAIQEAVDVAKSVDQVVICAGLSGEWESEGFDRTHMALPPGTDDLIAAVVAANPNTAVVIQSGTPVAMPWIDQVGAVVQAWFGGNECGNGIADVLFGEVNPVSNLSFINSQDEATNQPSHRPESSLSRCPDASRTIPPPSTTAPTTAACSTAKTSTSATAGTTPSTSRPSSPSATASRTPPSPSPTSPSRKTQTRASPSASRSPTPAPARAPRSCRSTSPPRRRRRSRALSATPSRARPRSSRASPRSPSRPARAPRRRSRWISCGRRATGPRWRTAGAAMRASMASW